MASRAIVRRRRLLYDHYNDYGRAVQGLSHGFSTKSSDSRELSPTPPDNTLKQLGITKYAGTSFRQEEFKNFTVPGVIRALKYQTIAGHTSPVRFSSLVSQAARFSSVASAPKPDLGKDEDDNEQVATKRKEASPEECDQAVEGLTSAKAKAKAKQTNDSQKTANPILKRTWAMLLGIGPALRVVTSISR